MNADTDRAHQDHVPIGSAFTLSRYLYGYSDFVVYILYNNGLCVGYQTGGGKERGNERVYMYKPRKQRFKKFVPVHRLQTDV